MALTYEKLGIRPLLIDKLNNAPISRSRSFMQIATALLRAGYALATRWLRAVLKLLLHRVCNLKPKESGVASDP
jgi:hypothetical protein